MIFDSQKCGFQVVIEGVIRIIADERPECGVYGERPTPSEPIAQ